MVVLPMHGKHNHGSGEVWVSGWVGAMVLDVALLGVVVGANGPAIVLAALGCPRIPRAWSRPPK
eukprot:12631039-Alexandrium_andersonii.AAC.1